LIKKNTYRNFAYLVWMCMVLITLGSVAQAQTPYWIQSGGGITIDEAYDISLDGQGNTYTTGYFTGTATFGTTSLVSSGSTDIFIVKTDNQGNFVWAQKAGGTGSDRGLAIATDFLGNSYVTGYFNGSATFGTTTLTSAGLQDMFVAMYNNAGVLQWVKQAGGTGADQGSGVSFNNSGGVFVTGSYKGSATFGTTTLTSPNSTANVFVTKLNSSGVFQWSKSGIGNYNNRGVDLGCDNNGNVYVTGHFSDTITFDVQHANQMLNAIFLVKFNSTGAEQWFRTIGAAATNIVNGIAVSGNGNCHLTGDFTGGLTFFGPPNNTITNTYLERIFVAKYNSGGTFQWAEADGSDSDITSKNIGIDNSGNIYIGGHFKCKLDEYSDAYGSAIFNSVGGYDIYVTKYNSSGTWQYSRHTGGQAEDKCFGVAANAFGQIHVAGSYHSAMNIPVSSNFSSTNLALWNNASCNGNSPYCGDPDYGKFYQIGSSGNSDAFILNGFDPNREPYDYYKRTGGGCQRDPVNVCIDTLCPDTITNCNTAVLHPITSFCESAGPVPIFSWSGGQPIAGTPNVLVNTSGTYFVTQTSGDGCFFTVDSVEVVIESSPNTPLISDDELVNVNALVTQQIDLCHPDSVVITGSGFDPANLYWWTGPGLPAGGVYDSVITATATGVYQFHVQGANGCEIYNQVNVSIYTALPPFDLEIKADDTVSVCDAEAFSVQLYDSVLNPSGAPLCLGDPAYSILTYWTVTPVVPFTTSCGTYAFFNPSTTGTYTISAMLIRENFCVKDTFIVSKTIYVMVNPSPVITPFTDSIVGGPFYCPGDSVQITAMGGPNYVWAGPGVNGLTDSSIYVWLPGTYMVTSSVYDTNIYGCTAQMTVMESIAILEKPQPTITSTNTIICPNDSVALNCDQTDGNFWEGPNGPISGGSFIFVTDPGQYYTVVNDSDSCGLVSNTIILEQYTTPMLIPTGDTFICQGDSTIITVQATNNSVIEWQAPLSGSSLTQVIDSAGVYTCKITSCGISTYASITIHSSSVLAQISGKDLICEDSTIVLSGLPGMASYSWAPGNQSTQSISVSNGGTYSLSVVDSTGCAASDTVTVTEVIVPASISSTALGFCSGDSLVLTGTSGMDNYQWSPNPDTTQQITIYQAGTYGLTVTDSSGCPGIADPIQVIIPDTFAPVNMIGSSHICEGDSVVLKAQGAGMNQYIWYPGNEQTTVLTVYQSGAYALITTDSFGCMAYSDTFNVQMDSNHLTVPIMSEDTLICAGTDVMMYASAGTDSIVWYSPLGSPPIHSGDSLLQTLTSTTTFYTRTELPPCYSEYASVTISTEDCDDIEIPNVFTPNGDGVNDYFSIKILGATCFKVEIYNRWGILIAELESQEDSWDGTMEKTGQEVSDGVYYYILSYCRYDGENVNKTGYITLNRKN